MGNLRRTPRGLKNLVLTCTMVGQTVQVHDSCIITFRVKKYPQLATWLDNSTSHLLSLCSLGDLQCGLLLRRAVFVVDYERPGLGMLFVARVRVALLNEAEINVRLLIDIITPQWRSPTEFTYRVIEGDTAQVWLSFPIHPEHHITCARSWFPVIWPWDYVRSFLIPKAVVWRVHIWNTELKH